MQKLEVCTTLGYLNIGDIVKLDTDDLLTVEDKTLMTTKLSDGVWYPKEYECTLVERGHNGDIL